MDQPAPTPPWQTVNQPQTPSTGTNFTPPSPSSPNLPPTETPPTPPPPSNPPVNPSPVMPTPPRKSPVGAIMIVLAVLVIIGLGIFTASRIFQAVKPKEPVTLTWWGLWESENVVRPLIDEYQTTHPDVKINYIFQSHREYRERLQNALAQGSGPDIFRIHSSWVPMFKNDLTSVPADIFPAATYETTFYPTTKTDLVAGGNYVAVPLMYDGLAMYVNEDLLTAAGKTVPTSWEELRQTAIDMSVCDSEDGRCASGDRILTAGAALGNTENVDHWQDILAVLMLQNNVNLNAPSGTAAEEALQYFTIFNRSDHIWDSTLPNSTQAFATGKVAIYFGPSWRVFDIKAINPTLKFETHPIPQLPIDPARNEKPITWASYWAEGVSRKSTHAKEAWDFVQFLSSTQSLQKLYQQAALSGRDFGEIYPRQDMATLVASAPYVAAYVQQAPTARSWYLTSFTHDGATGINTLLSKYFEDAVNGVNQGSSASEAVRALSAGVNQVLSRYGLVAPLSATTQ